MLDFTRGQKASVRQLCGGLELDLEVYHRAPVVIDVSCFGLDSAGRLSDEQYFVFYNQKQTPEGAVSMEQAAASGAVRFRLRLTDLPAHIHKLSFTAAIDGTRTMRELEKGYVRLLQGEREVGRFAYDGGQFGAERAIVICEVYRRGDDWRFNAVGRGFHGGLKALVESFGGVVQQPQRPAPTPPSTPGRSGPVAPTRAAASPPKRNASPANSIISALPAHVCTRMDGLARQCRGETEYLSSLYRNMFAVLSAYPKVAEEELRVVLCADASGSMFDLYRGGRIQRVVDKFFAFASTLTDACTMDLWAFGAKCRQFGAVTMDNVRDYTFAESGGFERWMSMLNYQYNNEPEAMRDVTMIYGGQRKPTFVLFLTDGRLSSDWEIEEILIKTSRYPLYWQFVGLHGEQYGILERLSEIDGRHTENAAFFQLDDIDDWTDEQLFHTLLGNLNVWLQELAYKGMLER